MTRHLSALGCIFFLLGGSSELHARDFTLVDPGELPNIKMDCEARRYVKGQQRQSGPFQLHVEVNFGEKRAFFFNSDRQDKIPMILTSIVPLPNQQAEYLVLTDGSASAVVSTQHKDVLIIKPATKAEDEYDVIGRNCKIGALG